MCVCLLQIYEHDSDFKVNDMVEFVGILSIDPAMVEFPEDTKYSDNSLSDHLSSAGNSLIRPVLFSLGWFPH